jgi:hypothetical protein
MNEFNGIKISGPNLIHDLQKRQEFQNLMETINLQQDEVYDCTLLNVWSYRKATDISDGVQLKFGNMVNGFPFELGGVPFYNSECAYIAGAYAGQDDDSIRIQKLIINERNGMKCKRIYRNLSEFTRFQRKDFYSFNQV